MNYKDIKGYIQRYGAAVMYNATYVVQYCIVGSTWIGFDDVEVVKIKVSFAKEMKLLGYFVWQVPYDDNWELSRAAQEEENNRPSKRRLLVIILTTTASIVLLGLVVCYLTIRMHRSQGNFSFATCNHHLEV
ncbi:hypothetical protein F2P56_013642 [Juglans regia]|uniref:GH18 domain-containing protein n=1 Tax=Juglans regia TaxID=51240 RepID=A0A833XQP7_JUGRE|nr:hypothetical protein F2P56_013642 [Juglans regia]